MSVQMSMYTRHSTKFLQNSITLQMSRACPTLQMAKCTMLEAFLSEEEEVKDST